MIDDKVSHKCSKGNNGRHLKRAENCYVGLFTNKHEARCTPTGQKMPCGAAIVADLEQLLTSGQFLCNHARNGDHGQTSIVQLFGLHLLEFIWLFGLETQRIKAEVTWLVVVADHPLLTFANGTLVFWVPH